MGKFANIDKMIGLGEESWRLAAERGLAHIRTTGSRGNRLVTVDGHEFITWCRARTSASTDTQRLWPAPSRPSRRRER